MLIPFQHRDSRIQNPFSIQQQRQKIRSKFWSHPSTTTTLNELTNNKKKEKRFKPSDSFHHSFISEFYLSVCVCGVYCINIVIGIFWFECLSFIRLMNEYTTTTTTKKIISFSTVLFSLTLFHSFSTNHYRLKIIKFFLFFFTKIINFEHCTIEHFSISTQTNRPTNQPIIFRCENSVVVFFSFRNQQQTNFNTSASNEWNNEMKTRKIIIIKNRINLSCYLGIFLVFLVLYHRWWLYFFSIESFHFERHFSNSFIIIIAVINSCLYR